MSRQWYRWLLPCFYNMFLIGSLFCTGIKFDAHDLSSFVQKLSWTHRIWVCFRRNWVGRTGFEFVSNSFSAETNSNPVRWTWFLWKKWASVVSVHIGSLLAYSFLNYVLNGAVHPYKVHVTFHSCLMVWPDIYHRFCRWPDVHQICTILTLHSHCISDRNLYGARAVASTAHINSDKAPCLFMTGYCQF